MLLTFLENLKIILKNNQSYSEKISSIVGQQNFLFIFLTTIIGTLLFNAAIYWLIKNASRYSAPHVTGNGEKNILKPKDHLWIILAYSVLTFISYIKVIKFISTDIFAFGGDSFNHYARLKESKNILTNSDLSIFHWPGIFFPNGLTAFDGPPTLYNDIVHLILSPLFNSVAIYNFIHISTFLLASYFCFLLVFEITKNKYTSFLTGFIYGFSHHHYYVAHLFLNLTHIELIPLIFYFYVKLNKNKINVTLVIIISVLLTFLAYQSLYYFFASLIFIFFFFIIPNVFKRKKLIYNAIPIFLALIPLSIWIIPMLQDPSTVKGFYSPHIFYNLDLLSLINATDVPLIRNNFGENSNYIGLPILILCMISMIKKLNYKYINIGFILLFILAMGSLIKINSELLPIITPEIILTFLPAYKSMRGTDRFVIFMMIPIGIMVSNTLQHYIKKRSILFAVMVFYILLSIQLTGEHINVDAPGIYKKIPEPPKKDFGLIEFPINNPIYWLWRADHQHNIVYGYLFIRGKKDKLFHQIHKSIVFDEKLSLKNLKSKGIRYIVSHKNRKENLYPDLYPLAKRKNREYRNVGDYLNKKDFEKLILLSSEKNANLYMIPDN